MKVAAAALAHRSEKVLRSIWSHRKSATDRKKLAAPTRSHHTFGAETFLTVFPQKNDSKVPSESAGRYWSLDWGMVHLVSVDTEWFRYETNLSDSKMIRWLEQDLASNTQPWTIVMQHKMPYTNGAVADSNVLDYLVPVFEKYNVDLVLGGHWHDYQRYSPIKNGKVDDDGVHYIISGGGGYVVSSTLVKDANGINGSAPGWYVDGHQLPGLPAPTDPLVYKAVFHFCHWRIDECEAKMEAVDINLDVFDSLTIKRC